MPECGAAALGSVLGYFGRMEPLEKLRIECGVSRNGSNALNIVKAARRYGLVAKGRRTDIEGLFRLPLPAILFWNFNHFVVLEGFSRDFVYLNDPATGPRRITYDELDASYTGIALTFEPGPDFRPGREQPSLYSLLRQRLAGAEWGLAYVAFVSLALVIPGIVAPAFTRIFVDDILLAGNRHWLGPLILGMILTMLVQGGLTWIQQTYLLRLYRRLGRAHSGRFFWHLLHLPLDFYAQRYGGEVANRLQLNDSVASLLSGELATAVFNGVTMLFFAAVMVAYSPLLAAVGIVSALLNLAFLRWMSRSRIDDNARLLQEQGKVIAATLMGLRSMETVKAGGGEDDLFIRLTGHHAHAVNAEQSLDISAGALAAVPTFLHRLTTAAVLALGGMQVLDGRLTLSDVTFGYSRLEPPLIESFSLHVEPASRVAVVGSSGSGKSTLAMLIAGLYRPWSGEILFDGKRREDIPREVWTQSVAMVHQTPRLFQGTIRDNLTLWDPTVPEERIIQAAKDACIHDDIMGRPGGYSGIVEEGGRNFSGGQRQRLDIARALVNDPSILILDEATSALDPVVEKAIDDNLRRRGCTCIIISHRLSTIRDCDEIIVLDRGRVAQRGTHEELKNQDGPYLRLIAAGRPNSSMLESPAVDDKNFSGLSAG